MSTSMDRSPTSGPEMRWLISVDQVLKLRKHLFKQSESFTGRLISGDDFKALVDCIYNGLPSTCDYNTVHESLRFLAGQVLTSDILKSTCWRMAGNLNRLRRYRPVPPWSRQQIKEWVPAQITESRPGRNRRGDPGLIFTFKILAGTSCPLEITRFWSLRFCRFLSTSLGFTRYAKLSYRYRNAAELVTLRVELLIDPKFCGTEPGFMQVQCSQSLYDYNRRQMQYRDRLDVKHACPFSYPKQHVCWLCPKGWETCRAAVHPRDYVFGPCGRCKRTSAPFDHKVAVDMCIDCFTRVLMRKDK